VHIISVLRARHALTKALAMLRKAALAIARFLRLGEGSDAEAECANTSSDDSAASDADGWRLLARFYHSNERMHTDVTYSSGHFLAIHPTLRLAVVSEYDTTAIP
jgi:hypothetical protein